LSLVKGLPCLASYELAWIKLGLAMASRWIDYGQLLSQAGRSSLS
jgi:hypothetical protein